MKRNRRSVPKVKFHCVCARVRAATGECAPAHARVVHTRERLVIAASTITWLQVRRPGREGLFFFLTGLSVLPKTR